MFFFTICQVFLTFELKDEPLAKFDTCTLSRQLADIDNVRAGSPHHNPFPAWMFLWCGRLARTP
jgi:hypothetical protein